MKYYISRSGESEGPFSYEEIVQMLGAQEISADTQCVAEGSQRWITVDDLVCEEKKRRAAKIERDRRNPGEPKRPTQSDVSYLERVAFGFLAVGLLLSVWGGLVSLAGGNWLFAAAGGSFLFWAVLVAILDRLNKILNVLSKKQ